METQVGPWPFNKKGRDMDFDDCKFIMVGADQGLKNYLSAMALDPTFMTIRVTRSRITRRKSSGVVQQE